MSSITTSSPEFNIEESDVRRVISILSVTFILATVTVPLRFIARWKLKTPFFLDDWLILGASILAAVPVWVYVESAYKQELGRHVEFNGPVAQINFRKKQYSGELVSILAIAFTKLSILAFYWRVFNSSQTMRVLIRVTASVVMCGSFGFLITSTFQCNPTHKVWDTVTQGTCINTNVFFLANAAFNIITDFGLLVLPLHSIWKLQISQSKKVMVSCLFTLGGLIIVVSVLRLCSLVHLNLKSDDVTWDIVYPTIWSIVEIQLGVFCACLPFLRPLFTEHTQKVQSAIFPRRQTRRSNTHSQELMESDENEEPKGEVVTHIWTENDQSVDEEKWIDTGEGRWPQEVDEEKRRQEIMVTRVIEWSAEEPANSLDGGSTSIPRD